MNSDGTFLFLRAFKFLVSLYDVHSMIAPLFMSTLEAQNVIALRTLKFLAGDADSFREAHLMIREKFDAAVEASISFIGGSTPASVINHYRKHVAAIAARPR